MLLILPAMHFRKKSLRIHTLKIFDKSARAGPAPPADPTLRRSIPWLLILGTFSVSIGIALCAGTLHWYYTRGFLLVDKPVSLGPGHIKTGPFTSNLKGTYSIEFDTQVPDIYDCPQYLALKTHWMLTRDGRVAAHRERGDYDAETSDVAISGMYLYYFDAEPGTYNLDVEVVSDGRCLDVGKPRLRVYLSSWDRAEYDDLNGELQLFSLLCAGIGFAFLFAHHFAMLRGSSRFLPLALCLCEQKPAWGITGLHYRRFPDRRSWAMNPVTNLPTIALMCALTGFIWLAPMWLLYARGQRSSQGLLVSLPQKGLPAIATASGLRAPIVGIDAKRHIYLNYKETTWEELPEGLEQALLGLPVRVVYFEGDNEIMFMDVARAIDVIQGVRAKAILWTPRAKAENR
jgi:biopolymer transport protein ExbD